MTPQRIQRRRTKAEHRREMDGYFSPRCQNGMDDCDDRACVCECHIDEYTDLRADVAQLEAELAEAMAEVKRIKGERILSVVFGHHKGAPRPFALYRREDATGVSGTGVVATGCEFEDGTVVLRWSSAFPTSVVFHERGMESVEAIHGHGGKTVVVWLSDEVEALAAMEQQRDAALAAVDLLTQQAAPAADVKRRCPADGPHGRCTHPAGHEGNCHVVFPLTRREL